MKVPLHQSATNQSTNQRATREQPAPKRNRNTHARSQPHQDGDYGQTRVFGAWGWGLVGALSGWLVGRFGAPAAFGGYLLLMLPCAWLSWRLECDPLKGKQQSGAAAAVAAAAAAVAGGGGGGDGGGLGVSGTATGSMQQGAVGLEMTERRQLDAARSHTLDQISDHNSSSKTRIVLADIAKQHSRGEHAAEGGEGETAPLLSYTAAPNSSSPAAAAGIAAAAAVVVIPQSFSAKLRLLLSCPSVIIFFCQATIMGFGIGVIGEFLFLYLQVRGAAY